MAATEAPAKPAEVNSAEKRQPVQLEEDDEFEEFDEESAFHPTPALCLHTSSPVVRLLRTEPKQMRLRLQHSSR